MPGYHAVLSPSGADRWMQCPGSVVLSEGLPDTSSDYADEGTAAHFLGAECLTSGKHPSEFLGREIVLWESPDGEGTAFAQNVPLIPVVEVARFEVTVDMAGYVNHYVQAVRQQAEGGVLLVEQSLPISTYTGEEGATGSADAVVITRDGELQIHDLKYGMGKRVIAEENRQLRLYALGALEEYGLSYDFDSIRLFIHQPRLASAPSEWAVSLTDLEEFGERVRNSATMVGIARTVEPASLSTYLAPSDEACQWCRAKADCPTLYRLVAESILEGFDDGRELTPEAIQDAIGNLEHASPASLSSKMKATAFAEMWIKAVRGRVETELLAGTPVPDYKIVRGKRGSRKWTDAAEAESVLKSMRLKVEEMYDLTLISPTTAEKLAKRDPPVIGPRQWKKLQDSITLAEGRLSVAPDSDPRPAVDMTPKVDDFADLGDDLI